jgi:pantetheine-phosphate adenylyltransferase
MDLQALLNRYAIEVTIEDVLKLWNAPHRRYHTERHLRDLLEQISAYPNLSQKDQDILMLAALFHDIIYEPRRSDNEERSAQFLLDVSKHSPHITHVVQLIHDTKHHVPSSPLSAIFCQMDMSIVHAPYETLLEWEDGIRYEYGHLPWKDYKERRIAFLESICELHENAYALKRLIQHVGTMECLDSD